MATIPLPTLDEHDRQPRGSIWSFEGRIGRGTFWATFVSLLLANVLVRLLLLGISSGGREMQPLVVVVALPATVVLVWLALAMQVKRWHDLDNSGWMVLLNLTIVAAPIVLIILGCVKGTVGPNKYGTDPLRTRLGATVPASEVQAIPPPEVQAPVMAPVGRVFGVFFSPKRTFTGIVARPSWLAPLFLLTIIWLGLNVVLVKRTDWMEATRQQIEKNKFAARAFEQMKPEDRDAAYQSAVGRAKMTRYVRGVVGWPLAFFIMAGIYLGAFKLIGGARTNYVTSLAVVAHAYLPMGLRELLGIPVNLVKDGSSIDPENFLASNVASFLGGDAPLWQIVLGSSVDIFVIWSLTLLAIGFSALDPKKVKLGTAFGIVFALWAVITLFFTGLASLVS